MRTALAALSTCLVALPAWAGFTVCNKTPHDAKVALGFFSGVSWSSKGWWTVPPKACRLILGGPLKARYYYLYATDELSGSWDGRHGFCVASAGTFEISDRDDCERHGYDHKGFFQIDTGQSHDYTQTLSE